MNNILIIGNGFDLYHKLPTRYTDFLFLTKRWKLFYAKYNENISTKTIEIDYLDVIYENGLLGSFAFFYVLIPVFIEAIKKLKEKSLLNLEYKTSIA